METEILNQIKQDKRFSFDGDLVIRKENGSKYVYNRDKHGNLLEQTNADGSKYVCAFGIKIKTEAKARTLV